MLKPYPVCIGRKFKREKLKKLIKPVSCEKKAIIHNYNLSEKNKIKFITQLFRWFKLDSRHYRISYFFKKKNYISNLDLFNLTVKIQKAGWKKLLLKLDYHMKDYKDLKRRSYSLNFKFFFLNIEDNKNKEITLDIEAHDFDIFNIFITTNSFYLDEIYYIINLLNSRTKKEKDENDYILEDLDHIFYWTRANKIISYDAYMPWYLTKEFYCMSRKYKRKFERKYYCIIREKKLKSIFPLKNVIGHIVVSDNKNLDVDTSLWQTCFINNSFKKKEDLFKELKRLIRRINRLYKINSIIVYFFIELLDK